MITIPYWFLVIYLVLDIYEAILIRSPIKELESGLK